MYIARRTGGGRGVYEIAGQTATGLNPSALTGRELIFEFGDGLVVPLGVSLIPQGGKPRLKMTSSEIQIQRQLAAILMLPMPRRDSKKWSEEYKAPSRQSYVIDQMQLAFVDHISVTTQARLVPDVLSLKNAGGEWFIQVDDRLRDVEYLWAHTGLLTPDLQVLIAKHQELVTLGQPITSECESVVSDLLQATGQTGDPLLALMPMLDKDEMLWQGHEYERVWKQIAQRRGQRPFRDALIQSYQQTCQVTAFTGSEALEAAHIVPYSVGGEWANDPTNGLLLRADIHTLFDLALLKVDPDTLRVRIMEPLSQSSYIKYHDTALLTSDILQPSREALAMKWNQEYYAG